eukprot:11179232-Lingulodinium_polyedra.AAC.1
MCGVTEGQQCGQRSSMECVYRPAAVTFGIEDRIWMDIVFIWAAWNLRCCLSSVGASREIGSFGCRAEASGRACVGA